MQRVKGIQMIFEWFGQVKGVEEKGGSNRRWGTGERECL